MQPTGVLSPDLTHEFEGTRHASSSYPTLYRAATENAEIANPWTERSDAFEAANEKQKAEHTAAAAATSCPIQSGD